MHVIPILTSLLATLRKRSPQDNGQYTIWTSTPSTYLSYYSTQVITVTTFIPCLVTTSYTTTTECSYCGETTFTCLPKTCTTNDGEGEPVAQQGTYSPGENVLAYETVGGVLTSSEVPVSQCPSFAPFVTPTPVPAGLAACSCSTGVTCQAKPCTSITTQWNNNNCASNTLILATSYGQNEEAYVVTGGQTFQTPAESCAVQTSPAGPFVNLNIESYETCGPGAFGDNNNNPNNNNNNGGNVVTTNNGGWGSVVTYTYVKNGATLVAVTTLPQRGGVLSAATRLKDGLGGLVLNLLLWLWAATALVSCLDMVVL